MSDTKQVNGSLPCSIECMCFNETAYTLAEEIQKICIPAELNERINVILSTDDLTDLRIGNLDEPIICQDGWSLV